MLPLLNQRLAATQPDAASLLWTGVAIVVAQLTWCRWRWWRCSRRLDLSAFVYLAIYDPAGARPARPGAFPACRANIPVRVLDGIAAAHWAWPRR